MPASDYLMSAKLFAVKQHKFILFFVWLTIVGCSHSVINAQPKHDFLERGPLSFTALKGIQHRVIASRDRDGCIFQKI